MVVRASWLLPGREGILNQERIPEEDALELAVVLHILTQQQCRSGLLCDGPLHRIPKRKAVVLDRSYSKTLFFRGAATTGNSVCQSSTWAAARAAVSLFLRVVEAK